MKGKKEKQEIPVEPAKAKKEPPKKRKQAKKSVSKAATPKPVAAKPKTEEIKPVDKIEQELVKAEPRKVETKILIDLKNAEIILEPSKRKKIRKIRVFVEGELTINNVDGFIQRIHLVFDDYDYVDFFLRKVVSLDLCFIQMLYHMKKSYAKKKKEVTIDSKLSSDLKKIIVQAGFEELMFIPKLV